MITLSFPNWSDALKTADLPLQVRERHRVIINWYLGHLKRASCPVTKGSARDFIEHLVATRHPKPWQLECELYKQAMKSIGCVASAFTQACVV